MHSNLLMLVHKFTLGEYRFRMATNPRKSWAVVDTGFWFPHIHPAQQTNSHGQTHRFLSSSPQSTKDHSFHPNKRKVFYSYQFQDKGTCTFKRKCIYAQGQICRLCGGKFNGENSCKDIAILENKVQSNCQHYNMS